MTSRSSSTSTPCSAAVLSPAAPRLVSPRVTSISSAGCWFLCNRLQNGLSATCKLTPTQAAWLLLPRDVAIYSRSAPPPGPAPRAWHGLVPVQAHTSRNHSPHKQSDFRAEHTDITKKTATKNIGSFSNKPTFDKNTQHSQNNISRQHISPRRLPDPWIRPAMRVSRPAAAPRPRRC